MARAGLRRLAQLLCRSGVEPVHPCVPPQAATPVDASVTPPVPASSFQLEAFGAHDRNLMVTRVHPPPMAGPAVRRQSPEAGAGWFSDHVRICAGGAQQCAFLPRSCDLQVMSLPVHRCWKLSCRPAQLPPRPLCHGRVRSAVSSKSGDDRAALQPLGAGPPA